MSELETFDSWIELSVNPERARIGLNNWLQATGNPVLYANQLASVPEFAQALLNLFGGSQAMCDLLVQNPELPTLYLEEFDPQQLPTKESVEAQGIQLLDSSVSYQHTLDRLRYLRQRKIFQIALVDVNGWQLPEKVWRALSELADAVLTLTRNAAWEYHCRMRFLGDLECPLHVIAFGKHGGHEVNYSSDLDLVFVLNDGLEEKIEREALRFGEALIKALTDRMGRGALYRIDMRLRPYGGAGELAKSMRATETYYNLYAEAWEVQALIRSRPVSTTPDLSERWEQMRQRHCFKAHVSEFTTDSILQTRERIDALADDQDFKRSRGGIRDIEFTVQMLQLVHGHRLESARVQGTLPALRALAVANLIPKAEAALLEEEYIWLRQLEHRCQLLHDQQTHSLPMLDEDLTTVGQLTGTSQVRAELSKRRERVAKVYYRFNHAVRKAESQFDLEKAGQFLGNHVDLDTLGRLLRENEGSLRRLSIVQEQAPLLADAFHRDWSLGEALLSGEIEESKSVAGNVSVGVFLRRQRAVTFCKWLLGSEPNPLGAWSAWCQGGLSIAVEKQQFPSGLSYFTLGSTALHEMFPLSDIDLVFVATNDAVRTEAELTSVPQLLQMWERSVQNEGNPVSLDLRLRPEGKQGLLVRTMATLECYMENQMEPWERYMLGFADLQAPLNLFDRLPWTRDHEVELMAVKHRVETERLTSETENRDVKIGLGGMMDVQWIARLTAIRKMASDDRPSKWHSPMWFLRYIDEEREIRAAYKFFCDLRIVLQLRKLGDLVPVDKEMLDAIALQMGLPNGDALWQKNLEIRHNVRRIYNQVVQCP